MRWIIFPCDMFTPNVQSINMRDTKLLTFSITVARAGRYSATRAATTSWPSRPPPSRSECATPASPSSSRNTATPPIQRRRRRRSAEARVPPRCQVLQVEFEKLCGLEMVINSLQYINLLCFYLGSFKSVTLQIFSRNNG